MECWRPLQRCSGGSKGNSCWWSPWNQGEMGHYLSIQWEDLWPQNLMPCFQNCPQLYWFPHAALRKHSPWYLQTLEACLTFLEVKCQKNNVLEGLFFWSVQQNLHHASFLPPSGGQSSMVLHWLGSTFHNVFTEHFCSCLSVQFPSLDRVTSLNNRPCPSLAQPH